MKIPMGLNFITKYYQPWFVLDTSICHSFLRRWHFKTFMIYCLVCNTLYNVLSVVTRCVVFQLKWHRFRVSIHGCRGSRVYVQTLVVPNRFLGINSIWNLKHFLLQELNVATCSSWPWPNDLPFYFSSLIYIIIMVVTFLFPEKRVHFAVLDTDLLSYFFIYQSALHIGSSQCLE